MPRLFSALDLPLEIKHELATKQFGLEGAKWHDLQDFHITLCFIGDIHTNAANELVEKLQELTFKPQIITLTELSFFGSTKPRSLHVKVKDNLFLEGFVKKKTRILEELELNVEHRAFMPHVTLASLQKGITPFEVTTYIENQSFKPMSFEAKGFSLFQGKDGGGAPYVKILEF